MRIELIDNPESEISEFRVSGLTDINQRTEQLVTDFLMSLYDWKFYKSVTLNNWKNGVLYIRFAKNSVGYEKLNEGLRNEKQLEKNHPERSLLGRNIV